MNTHITGQGRRKMVRISASWEISHTEMPRVNTSAEPIWFATHRNETRRSEYPFRYRLRIRWCILRRATGLQIQRPTINNIHYHQVDDAVRPMRVWLSAKVCAQR